MNTNMQLSRIRLLFVIAVAIVTMCTSALAAPNLISYQGQLTDSVGDPVTTPTTVRISPIWNGNGTEFPTTGTVVYQEDASVTPDADGVFSHLIGSGTAQTQACDENGDDAENEDCVLSAADFPGDGTPVFLELLIDLGGADDTLLPRQRITSVGFAMNSADTLDSTYDQGGPGDGRVITADAGPVEIAGPDGLVVADQESQ